MGLAVISLLAAGFGCHKNESGIATQSSPPASSPATTNVAPPPPPLPAHQPAAPTTVEASPNGGADLRALNHAYVQWIVASHKRPKSYEQFVAESGIHVPPAPAGKKYVIDKAGFIALVAR